MILLVAGDRHFKAQDRDRLWEALSRIHAMTRIRYLVIGDEIEGAHAVVEDWYQAQAQRELDAAIETIPEKKLRRTRLFTTGRGVPDRNQRAFERALSLRHADEAMLCLWCPGGTHTRDFIDFVRREGGPLGVDVCTINEVLPPPEVADPEDSEAVEDAIAIRVTQGELAVSPRMRRIYEPFDAAGRKRFLQLLSSGPYSHADAVRMCRFNPDNVARWIYQGRRTDADIMASGQWVWFRRKGYKYRQFVVEYEAALAAGENLAEAIMAEKAVGGYVYEDYEDPETGEKKKVIVREGADWRAADALAKRHERRALLPLQRQLLAEKVAEQAAAARRTAAQAEMAERLAHPSTGMVVFQSGFLEALRPDERRVVEGAMVRLGYREANEPAVASVLDTVDLDELAEEEAWAEKWADNKDVS